VTEEHEKSLEIENKIIGVAPRGSLAAVSADHDPDLDQA
jgi:hypothetical protein